MKINVGLFAGNVCKNKTFLVIFKHCDSFCIIEEPVSNILHDLQWVLKVMSKCHSVSHLKKNGRK